jgi:hypothetical protein
MFLFPLNNISKHRIAATTPSRRWLTAGVLWCITFYGMAPAALQAQGNISPNTIQIDQASNHFNNAGDSLRNAGASSYVDWVANSTANPDIVVGANGAAQLGHWNGLRVVDGTGIAANPEKDIFLQGGKVNDPDSWVIGPGSTGSSKFDATQMYLANNNTNLFLGMERAGNNGTTAFDFEFNKLAPDPNDPRNSTTTYIPNRSQGDRLISYELQGSGGASGTVFTYIFKYNGTTELYEPECDDDPSTPTGQTCGAGLVSSINGANTPAPPWGYVNTQGNWVTGNMNQRLFAETQVPLTVLNPDISNGCGATFFVQIRTRASSALGSDAKDTTPVFEYTFGQADAEAVLTNGCGTSIHYDATASTNAEGTGAGLTYNFKFEKYNAGTDSWDAVAGGTFDDNDATPGVGDFDPGVAGTYRAIITVAENGECTNVDTSNEVTVTTNVGGSASLSTSCAGELGFTAQGTGGSGSYSYAWRFFKDGGEVVALQTTAQSGSITGLAGGFYTATVTITDANEPACLIVVNPTGFNVRPPLTISAAKDAANTGFGSPFGDDNFNATVKVASHSGGSDTLTLQWQQLNKAATPVFVDIASQNGTSLVRSMSNIFADGTIGSGSANFATVSGTDPYVYRVGALTVRVHASRTVNAGMICEANSGPVVIKALKAIDP